MLYRGNLDYFSDSVPCHGISTVPCLCGGECCARSAGIELEPDPITLLVDVPRGVQEISGLT